MFYSFMTENKEKDIYKTRSPLVEEYSSITETFSLDNLHQLYSGVEKRYLHYHFDSKFHDKPWYIQPSKIKEINDMISQIRLPSNYHQIPSIKKFKLWKAEEIRSFFHFAGGKFEIFP